MSTVTPSADELIGREPQQAALDALGERLVGGSGGGALLVGEAGVGKSALLGWWRGRLPAGPTVIAVDIDPDLPGLGLSELIGRLGLEVHVEPDPDDLRTAATDRATLAVVEAVERRLDELLLDEPVVVAIEDLHWATPTLLVVLRRLSRLARDRPLLVVATLRPEGANPMLARTLEQLGAAGFERLPVEALDDEAVLALTERLAGGRPIGRLRRLVDRAGRNPLLLRQLVDGLRDAIALRPNGTADVDAAAVPDSAGVGLARRLDQVSADAALVCRVVAVLGTASGLAEVAAVADRSEAELREPLQEAVTAGLLVDSGGRIRFAHELLREAVHTDLADSVRRPLHRQAARVLRGADADPIRVAYHLSFDPGDDAAVLDQIADSVRHMAVTDPEAALAVVERVTAGADAAVVARFAPLRAEPLAWLGRVREAADVARAALADAGDPDDRLRSSRLLADLMVTLGRPAEVVDVLDEALDGIGPDDPGRPLLAGEVALARFTSGDLVGAVAAAGVAAAGDDPMAVVLGRLLLGRLQAHHHGYRAGIAEGWRAAELADAEGTGSGHRYLPWFFCALTCFDVDSPDTARALANGRDRCDRYATYWATPLYDGLAAAIAHREGRYDDCLAEADAAYGTAVETGSVQGVVWNLAHRALVELDRGDEAAASTLAEADEWWASGRAMLGIDHFFLAGARARLRAGAPAEAFDRLDGGWRLFAEMGLENCLPLLAPDLVRLAVALGRAERAAAVAGEVAGLAERGEAAAHRALADWCGGLVERGPDRVAGARMLFLELGRRTDALWCGMDLAVLQAGAGDPGAARTTRDEVLAVLDRERLGALRREFLAAVEPFGLGKLRKTVRPRFGWGSLTKTERAIVELVAEGRSNAEIAEERSVSVRTVESHLHRVYTKLEVETRTQLAVEADRHRTAS